jgi:copper chaperone
MYKFIFIAIIALSMGACSTKQAPKANAQPVMVEANLKVNGMHCDNCEASIAKGVNELAGIDSISANYEDSTAYVRFDSNQTDLNKIKAVIEDRGFEVAEK